MLKILFTSEILNTACIFNTIFRQHNIIVFSTCQNKYKWILSTKKLVLIVSFQEIWCTNVNNHLICFEKTINTYLKAKIPYTQHKFLALNMYLLSFKKNSDANIKISQVSAYKKTLILKFPPNFWIRQYPYKYQLFCVIEILADNFHW